MTTEIVLAGLNRAGWTGYYSLCVILVVMLSMRWWKKLDGIFALYRMFIAMIGLGAIVMLLHSFACIGSELISLSSLKLFPETPKLTCWNGLLMYVAGILTIILTFKVMLRRDKDRETAERG